MKTIYGLCEVPKDEESWSKQANLGFGGKMLEITWNNPNPPDTLKNSLMKREWTVSSKKLRLTKFTVGVGQGFLDYFVIAKVPKLGTP